jgi:microcystin-dependent protein
VAEFFLGQVMMTGFGYPQKNFAQCNGQLMPINQNTALFSLLGTSYGGDGMRTFQLPNLQGSAFYGAGNSADGTWQPSPLPTGAVGGSETVTVQVPNLPIHTHLMNATTTAGSSPRSVDNTLLGKAAHNIYGPPNSGPVQLALGTLQSAGGGAAHANMQPFQVINFNIALYGIFPSRG